MFMASNTWYLFLRLHQILCERLTRMYERAMTLAAEEAQCKLDRKESTAIALRLKPKSEFFYLFLLLLSYFLCVAYDCTTLVDEILPVKSTHLQVVHTQITKLQKICALTAQGFKKVGIHIKIYNALNLSNMQNLHIFI